MAANLQEEEAHSHQENKAHETLVIMEGEMNMADNVTSIPDDKAVPVNKKSEKSKKKRPCVVNSSDLEDSSTEG